MAGRTPHLQAPGKQGNNCPLKDFWVCWTLDYLFQDSPWKDRMAFKGGASLSKVYRAIERFSEDIDPILYWRLLGYSEDEPWQERSPTKQDAFGNAWGRSDSLHAANQNARALPPRVGHTLRKLQIRLDSNSRDKLMN